jgi:ketosteroid isomerase-like protein
MPRRIIDGTGLTHILRGYHMRRIILALAVALAAGPAAASDKTDVMATLNQFIDGFNKGDVKAALATCASPVSIVDEFPPFAWQGPTACADWATDFEANAKKDGITDAVVTLAKPKHVVVAADRAYVVVKADYKYKLRGKKVSQKGATMTVALQKSPAGWRITGWAWATG